MTFETNVDALRFNI